MTSNHDEIASSNQNETYEYGHDKDCFLTDNFESFNKAKPIFDSDRKPYTKEIDPDGHLCHNLRIEGLELQDLLEGNVLLCKQLMKRIHFMREGVALDHYSDSILPDLKDNLYAVRSHLQTEKDFYNHRLGHLSPIESSLPPAPISMSFYKAPDVDWTSFIKFCEDQKASIKVFEALMEDFSDLVQDKKKPADLSPIFLDLIAQTIVNRNFDKRLIIKMMDILAWMQEDTQGCDPAIIKDLEDADEILVKIWGGLPL